MYKVVFYSFLTSKHVVISSHRKLDKAVLKARKSRIDDGYNNVSIIAPDGTELDIYGNKIVLAQN